MESFCYPEDLANAGNVTDVVVHFTDMKLVGISILSTKKQPFPFTLKTTEDITIPLSSPLIGFEAIMTQSGNIFYLSPIQYTCTKDSTVSEITPVPIPTNDTAITFELTDPVSSQGYLDWFTPRIKKPVVV